MLACTAATASLSVVSVSALTRCTRSWFLRSIDTGPVSRSMIMMFLAGSTWPLGVLSSTSPTSAISSRSSCAQPDDDRVFVARFAEHRGLRAGDVGADGVGHAGHGEAEHGGLVAIDADGELGPAFFTLQPRIGDAGRRLRASP